MPDWLDVAALQHPHTTALSFGDRHWTYRQLLRETVAAAQILQRKAHPEGGRVGVLSANRPGFVMLVHACRRLHAECVPLNWRLSPSEVAWQVRAANVTTLFADDPRMSLAGDALRGHSAILLPL